ncbi:hypothetical protein GCM10010452_45130 [Crossiella cryophila]
MGEGDLQGGQVGDLQHVAGRQPPGQLVLGASRIAVLDPAVAARLWQVSAELTGVGPELD